MITRCLPEKNTELYRQTTWQLIRSSWAYQMNRYLYFTKMKLYGQRWSSSRHGPPKYVLFNIWIPILNSHNWPFLLCRYHKDFALKEKITKRRNQLLQRCESCSSIIHQQEEKSTTIKSLSLRIITKSLLSLVTR